jgi:GNAT superfamily N-acetyltransferase
MTPQQLQIDGKSIVVRAAAVEEIIPLRHRILRAGLPIEEARFSGDDASTTHHAAAYDNANSICCATFVLNEWENQPAWQLRGMATDAAWQSRGLGAAVLNFAIALVRESSPVPLFWCNARIGALSFYLRQGWQIRSQLFEIPTAGPHHKMTLHLQPN